MKDPILSVVCCVHNEENYIDGCLTSVVKAISQYSYQIIVVLDRCSDETLKKSKKYGIEIVEKNYRTWRNSYAEALQLGLKHAKGKTVAIVDADMVVPSDLFNVLLPLLKGKVASVSPLVVTYPLGILNQIVYAKEKSYRLAPFGRGTYGIKVMSKQALDSIGGFRDSLGIDTDLDMRLKKKGYESILTTSVKVFHMRKLTIKNILKKQLRSGQARRMLNYGFLKTVAHALFRLRPFVLVGWFLRK